MKLRTWMLVSALVGLTACDNEPGAGKPQAQVSTAAAATAAASEGATKYVFSAQGSKVEFVGAKVTGKHDGSFGAFEGAVHVVDDDATKSSVEVTIDMASVTTDNEKLTGHLKSEDFFDVAKYPKAKFVSTRVAVGGSDGATHTITGNLELHGVTKAITFPATIKLEAGAVSVSAEFAVNRKDFSIVYPGMPDDLIKDDVLIKLTIAAKKG